MKPSSVILKQLVYFVGQQKTIEQIQQRLNDTGYLYLDFVEGVEGMGKSSLLVKLYEDLKKQKEYHPIWVCMTVFDPTRKGKTDPASLTHLTSNLDDYRRFLLELADEFPQNIFGDFGSWVEKLFTSALCELMKQHGKVDLAGLTVQTGDIHVGCFSRLADGNFKTGDVIVQVPDHDMRMMVDHLKNTLTQEFVQRINQCENSSRCVLLIDNFHLVLDDVLGQWFLTEVAPKLDNTVVVIAKAKTFLNMVSVPDMRILGLENFSLEDIDFYLKKRFEKALFPKEIAECLFKYTGGHPQAVVLAADVCDSLYKNGLRGRELLNVFQEVPHEHATKMIKLVDKIKESLDDQIVLKALEIGWVLRRFDAEILRALLIADEKDHSGDPPQKYQDIISRLEEYSFTEDHEEFYKFHDFIRQSMEGRLNKNDPKRYAEIHCRAARYYGAKLMEYDQERKDQSSYLRWYRYESYEWQCLVTEWLYHFQHTPERQMARLIFSKVYFDAFWWWGAYESFPFCERLLSEAHRIRMSDEDRDWLRLIQNFHQAYPTGYQKRGKGNWRQVQTALCCMRQLIGTEDQVTQTDSDHRHLRAITNVFLAQAHFYQDLKDPKAEEYLLEALTIFQEDHDEWNTHWVMFHLADLYMNWHDHDKALGMIRKALNLALQPPVEKRDYEILASMHRVTADVYWQMGQTEKSFCHYACAIAGAYFYHGFPSPPDLYTRAFQREMMERVITRLKELGDAGQGREAVLFAQGLQQFFLPYWKVIGHPLLTSQEIGVGLQESQKENLYGLLFPRPPQDEELNRRGTAYIDQCRRLIKELGSLENIP
jgi:hypothetical protein